MIVCVINYRFSTNLFTLTKYESNMASIRVHRIKLSLLKVSYNSCMWNLIVLRLQR